MKQLSRQIKKIEAKEKKGSYGAWRKVFCRKYLTLLIRTRNNTHNSLVEKLSKKGESITCRKACTHCCYHYVAVSLAHGIVIVDYLYKRKEFLKQFVDNHQKWHRRGYSVSNRLDRTRIQALSTSQPIERVIADTRPLSGRYLEMNIRCPFLVDKTCFIYDVRPLACSGHYAASPPDWCAPSAEQTPVIHHRVPDDQDLTDLTLLADPRLTLYELTLPTMIHRILSEGSSSIMDEIVESGFG